MDKFCTWDNIYDIYAYEDACLGSDKCINFQKELFFELGNSMLKKYWSLFQDQVKYIHNDIVKPFRVLILQYVERICEMHDLAE